MSGTTLMGLVRELARTCRANGDRIAVAESCTGGGLAAAMTSIAGSSNWFDRGFVTYSNEAKQDMVGVSSATDPRTGAPIVSLYGENFEDLIPKREHLTGLDVLLVDLADVGAR